jgi:hypothetical protein
MSHDVFISYSSKDAPVANAICDHIEAAGICCWMAPRSIQPSANYPAAIEEAIETARIVLLILTPYSNDSVQVQREIERAVHHKCAIVPMIVRQCELSKTMNYLLAGVHWLDASKPHYGSMVATLQTILGQAVTTPPIIPDPCVEEVQEIALDEWGKREPAKKSRLGSLFSRLVGE